MKNTIISIILNLEGAFASLASNSLRLESAIFMERPEDSNLELLKDNQMMYLR